MSEEQVYAHVGILKMKLRNALMEFSCDVYDVDKQIEELRKKRELTVEKINQHLGAVNALQEIEKYALDERQRELDGMKKLMDERVAAVKAKAEKQEVK